MKQQILGLTSKRKYQETQSNFGKQTFFYNDFEGVKKKLKKEATITQNCLFSLDNYDNENSLQFEDLINLDVYKDFGKENEIELFDVNGETVMDVNSVKQLNSLLLNQQHLNMEQKMVVQKIYYEKLDNNNTNSNHDKFQNISNYQTTLTLDENISQNQNYIEYLAQNEQQYSKEFYEQNFYESEIDTGECQDSQIQILEIGFLDADAHNQSFEQEELYLQQSSCQIISENEFIQTEQQDQETPLFKKSAFIASEQNQEKIKPQFLQQKKIRKRKHIKPKLNNTRQKVFFKLVQQIPSLLSKLKIKMFYQKGIQNQITALIHQQTKQHKYQQMIK
ncbi:hypothetical protein ABPG72_005573 [Tetrahymena utriculariae]